MIMEQIFNKEQQEKAQFILNHPLAKLSDLRSNEIKDLAVVWCYYSGKIEGNTYTYVETEALLKDDITSEKKYEDAKMLKNLYNTFISELEYINKGKNQEVIDERTLFRVHQAISTGLVSDEESGYLRTRGVRISGTAYIPPKNLNDIRAKLNEILYQQEQYTNPLERAVYLHCNIAIGLIQLELGYAESADISNEEAMALYDKYAKEALELMLAKNHDYDEAWRSMRVSSYTDLILMKIYRTKQIESLAGNTLVSEGIDANYMDMINYSVFGLIKIEFEG